MDIYIKEFLNNPAGKGSAVLNISSTKEKFKAKYDTICKKISHKTYSVKNDIYILVNIPSSVEGIFYDVLLKFSKGKSSVGKSITDMSMKIFSNSPSFLYTFANAYDKQKIFLRECRKKLSSKMLSDIAKTRNPYGVLSYDFSVFAALFYIVNNGYTSIEDLKMNDYMECGLNKVIDQVKHADTLQKNRKLQKDYNKMMEEKELKKKKDSIHKFKYNESEESDNTKNKTIKKVKSNNSVTKNKTNKKVKKI